MIEITATLAWLAAPFLAGLIAYGIQYRRHKKEWDDNGQG